MGNSSNTGSVFGDTSDQSTNGIKEKNFNQCSFKVTLPQMTMQGDVLKLSFAVMSKPGIDSDVSLNEVYLVDKLNRRYDNYYMGKCKPKEMHSKSFSLDISIENRQFMPSNSQLVLYFLASDNRKYEICYSSKITSGVSLEYVMGSRLYNEEVQRLEESLRLFRNPEKSFKDFGYSSNETVRDDEDPENHISPPPELEKYKEALLREKNYLQKEGGRKYRLTNGELISQSNGLCSYSFEMETELHLSDDAPVFLHVGDTRANGSVLVCEGFQLIVIVDKDFGKVISQAVLGVEPWKLLEALAKKLDHVSLNSKLAMKLIKEGPALASKSPEDAILKGQETAIHTAEKNDITVIWCPPGTGKTYTMGQIARRALQNRKKILIVSHSNISVDGAIKQTVAELRNAGMDSLLSDGKILRYGYVRDEELSRDSDAVAYNYVLKQRPDLKSQIEELCKERDQLKRNGAYKTDIGERVEKKQKKLRNEVRTEERQYVENARLIATTISKITADSLFDGKKYDIVMFDDVSMAYVPQIVCAASFARKKLILVGDFRQLSPIVQSDAREVLAKDIFSYLGISKGMKVYAHPWLVMLNEQASSTLKYE